MDDLIERFPHRVNKDGTFDSICPNCFETIATRNVEEDLKEIEEAHLCTDVRYMPNPRR
jgi:hypothetical protein